MKQSQFKPLLNVTAHSLTAAAKTVRTAILGDGHSDKMEADLLVMCKVVNSPIILAAYTFKQYSVALKDNETICCLEIRTVANNGVMHNLFSSTLGNVRETKAIDFGWTYMNYVLNLMGNPNYFDQLKERSRNHPFMKVSECKPPRVRKSIAENKKLKVITKSSTKKKAA